jgi:hypothetical protein
VGEPELIYNPKEQWMKKLRGRRPSPAMIVAVIALSMSLVGTGVAATISVLNSQEKKQVKGISRKIANKRITKRVPGYIPDIVAREGTPVPVPAGGTVDGFAKCNPDEKLVGGGSAPLGIFGPGGNGGYIQFDGPDRNVPNQWQVKVYSTGVATLIVTAYCLS